MNRDWRAMVWSACGVALLGPLGCGSRTSLDLAVAVAGEGGVRAGRDGAEALDAASVPDVRQSPDTGAPPCNDGGLLAVGYLYDDSGILYRYDPITHQLEVLGTPSCGDTSGPWTMTASLDHAFIVFTDWSIYSVDLQTLECSYIPLDPSALGLTYDFGVAATGTGASEQIFVYGVPESSNDAILAVSDTTSFALNLVGAISPVPPEMSFPVNLSADSVGHLFAFSSNGYLQTLDSATGVVIAAEQTGINTTTWAGLSWGPELFLFAGTGLYGLNAAGAIISDFDSGVAPIGAGSAVLCN